MIDIPGYIGLAACQVIGGLVPRCETGQSLAVVGYWTAAIVIIGFSFLAFLDRTAAK
jgi:hypothetical protein